MLLKHQCSYLHIQEIQLKSFVHKKDYQSLNGMIDLSTYQPVYNIKIISMSTIFLHDRQKVIQNNAIQYPRRVLI